MLAGNPFSPLWKFYDFNFNVFPFCPKSSWSMINSKWWRSNVWLIFQLSIDSFPQPTTEVSQADRPRMHSLWWTISKQPGTTIKWWQCWSMISLFYDTIPHLNLIQPSPCSMFPFLQSKWSTHSSKTGRLLYTWEASTILLDVPQDLRLMPYLFPHCI